MQDMKFKIKKSITVDFTLDSSETVMFNKGGMHTIKILRSEILHENDDTNYEMVFNVQMEKNSQARHDFITTEAAKAIHRRDEENKNEN